VTLVLDKIFKWNSIALFIVAMHGTFVFFGMTKSNPLDYFKDESVQIISSDIDYLRHKLDRLEIEIRIIEDKKAREIYGIGETRLSGAGSAYKELERQSLELKKQQDNLWLELKILQEKRDSVLVEKKNKGS
jgi:hypothetical protein